MERVFLYKIWGVSLLLSVGACSAPSEEPASAEAASEAISLPAGLDVFSSNWDMAGHDAFGHHNNRVELKVRSSNVDELEVKWTFDEEDFGEQLGAIHGTPVVTEDTLFVGTSAGRFLAVNLDGTLRWDYATRQPNPILGAVARPSPVGGQIPDSVGTPVVGGAIYSARESVVVFGDMDGNIYGLDAATGEEVWVQERLDAHPLGGIVGNSLLRAGNKVVIGFAAIEDAGLLLPDFGIPYECCSHTGFVAALDIATGELEWRYDTIDPAAVQPLSEEHAPFALGPSGADIWAQPTYDPLTRTVYIGTGQNYSPEEDGTSTDTSDALIALDARTGEEKWVQQITENDIWVVGIPSPNEEGKWVDQDFGDALKIYRLADGRKVVGAAQKSGAYTVVDAHTGEVIETTEIVQQANQLGGLQNGSAYGRGKVFVHGQDGYDPMSAEAPFDGRVMALSPDGTQVKWSFDRFFSIFAAPLALARDVLYFISPVEEAEPGTDPFEFALYALDADTGEQLARFPFPGRAVSGPVVSDAHVYMVTGNRAIEELGVDDNGSIICLGRPSAP